MSAAKKKRPAPKDQPLNDITSHDDLRLAELAEALLEWSSHDSSISTG
jgi:hypothetical protein